MRAISDGPWPRRGFTAWRRDAKNLGVPLPASEGDVTSFRRHYCGELGIRLNLATSHAGECRIQNDTGILSLPVFPSLTHSSGVIAPIPMSESETEMDGIGTDRLGLQRW